MRSPSSLYAWDVQTGERLGVYSLGGGHGSSGSAGGATAGRGEPDWWAPAATAPASSCAAPRRTGGAGAAAGMSSSGDTARSPQAGASADGSSSSGWSDDEEGEEEGAEEEAVGTGRGRKPSKQHKGKPAAEAEGELVCALSCSRPGLAVGFVTSSGRLVVRDYSYAEKPPRRGTGARGGGAASGWGSEGEGAASDEDGEGGWAEGKSRFWAEPSSRA